MSSLKKQAGYLITGKVFDFAIQFFIPIILVRLLSKESYGDYGQVMLIALFFIDIIPLGFANSLLYFYSIAGEKRDQLISQTLLTLFISGIIISVLFILFKYQIAIFFNNDIFLSYIFPVSLFMLFSVGSIIFENTLVVEKRSKYVLVYLTSNQFLRGLFLISAVLLFKTIEAVLWALVVFSFIRLVIFLIYIFRRYNISFATINRGYFLLQLNYAIPLGLAKIVGIYRKSRKKCS